MKKENAKAEDEKKLVWKLQEKPSGHVVAELVANGVIDKEEARSILFREEVKQSDEVVALKEMVNTLQEMVKDLLQRQPTQITKVIEVPTRYVPYWNKVMLGGGSYGGVISASSTSGSSGSATYTLTSSI